MKSTSQKIVDFVKYNNAFTIAFVLVFFGFGISFAASPELRDGVYSSEETVVSIDNSMIISTDLDNFNFNLKINSITEDEKNYYAVYSYQTLAITDDIWQGKEIEKTLAVDKDALGGKDLGLYVAQELGENINYELSYLKRVQQLEKEKGEAQKVVAVEYSGLIGKLLDPKEKVIEGYNPVIPEPVPEVPAAVKSNPEEVIVSVQHPEPEITPATEPLIIEPLPSVVATGEATTTPPAPEEIINEGLVQEVVQELLQNEASSTPALETTTPEVIAPVPEIIPEPSQ